jgi:hypothetical protein
MATFNTAQANFGQSNVNPANAASGLGNAVGAMMASRGPNKKSAEVYKDMMSHEHGLNKDMATHLGGIQLKINRGEQRHEMDKIVQTHNQSQEAAALAHHQGLETATTQAGLQQRLETQKQRHEFKMQSAAHGNAVNFASHIGSLAEGVTSVDFSHGDTKAKFTFAKPKATAPAGPAKPKGPQLVGMPLNIATAGKPAVASTPAKVQKYAHRDLNTNKISHYEDKPQVLPTKKATAKKAAPKKRK